MHHGVLQTRLRPGFFIINPQHVRTIRDSYCDRERLQLSIQRRETFSLSLS